MEENEAAENLGPLYFLMTTVAVLGLLAAIYLPSNLRARAMGRLEKCHNNLETIAAGLEAYQLENNGQYPTSIAQLIPGYLKSLPQCPSAEGFSYKTDFGPKARGNEEHSENFYTIWCAGEHHSEVNQPSDSPYYNGPATDGK